MMIRFRMLKTFIAMLQHVLGEHLAIQKRKFIYSDIIHLFIIIIRNLILVESFIIAMRMK